MKIHTAVFILWVQEVGNCFDYYCLTHCFPLQLTRMRILCHGKNDCKEIIRQILKSLFTDTAMLLVWLTWNGVGKLFSLQKMKIVKFIDGKLGWNECG